MQVTVQVFGKLRHDMPANNMSGKYPLDFSKGETLAQLLEKIPLPKHKPFLVLHNDSKIASDRFSSTLIHETDNIVVLTPIKGG